MFWSAALDLKTQRPPPRPSYGSFSRVASNSSFRIPQSIPEHQPVSQFTSPVPTDSRRVEEYFERPGTASARTRASLQLSEHTQTALKLLLQGECDSKPQPSTTLASTSRKPMFASISGYSARRTPRKELPERPSRLEPLARRYEQEEPNPQENSNEHNYWTQELERRRAGMRRSRRRTCTTMSERATTSPLKVGVVMCSVPLVLALGFVLFVVLFGEESGVSSNVTHSAMNNLLDFGGDADFTAKRHDTGGGSRAEAGALPPEKKHLEKENLVLMLAVSTDRTRLRGS